MEVIKKRICIEPFISRIPALIETVENTEPLQGSWGKIPKPVTILGTKLSYKTFIDCYHALIKVINNAVYYEYDFFGDKWLSKEYTLYEVLKNKDSFSFNVALPETSLSDMQTVGIVENLHYYNFYENVENLIGKGYNGFDFIEAVHTIIGKRLLPEIYHCNKCGYEEMTSGLTVCSQCSSSDIDVVRGIHVPNYIYLSEVKDLKTFLRELKSKSTDNCCGQLKYDEYGGDALLNYLNNIKESDIKVYPGTPNEMVTLDIPLLLTSNLLDLGMYRPYDVDVITEDGFMVNEINEQSEETQKNIIITSGESKFRTLRRRKRSIDDNGVELPGILVDDDIISPYQVGYLKNIQTNNKGFYGDMIVSMEEKADIIPIEMNDYDGLIARLKPEFYSEGTEDEPISGLNKNDVVKTFSYGDTATTQEDAYTWYKSMLETTIATLTRKLSKLLKDNYPQQVCYKQKYKFIYKIKYGVIDKNQTFIDENGITQHKILLKTEDIVRNYDIYVSFTNPTVEVIYVLGGRLQGTMDSLTLREQNPFLLPPESYNNWDGSGIWYKETFNMKKAQMDTYTIDGEEKTIKYDMIDLSANETTYSFEGIDFPRKNFILCNEIMYKADAYLNDCTHDIVFRDEKMIGLTMPLREDIDVTMSRGLSCAYERHLQLSEIKTWEDLENYRNGMFLNK
jgi:hypothetical protein